MVFPAPQKPQPDTMQDRDHAAMSHAFTDWICSLLPPDVLQKVTDEDEIEIEVKDAE